MIPRLLYDGHKPWQPFNALLLQPDFVFPAHCHDFWEAFLCLGGSGIHDYNGQRYKVAAGDLWIIRPDDVHSIHPLHGFIFINVSWPLQNWDAWQVLAGVEGESLIRHSVAPQLESLFRRMAIQASVGMSTSNCALELCRFWTEIVFVATRHQDTETRPDWMRRAMQAMADDDGLRAGWPLLLQTAHVSPGHLCREWKKAFGQTPTEWINARRLENAARLLLQSNLSIEAISTRCGFKNLTYFYRLFRRKYGMAPRAYRLKSSIERL